MSAQRTKERPAERRLFYPSRETGYDLEADYPNSAAWRDRIRALDGWNGPYELMPGPRGGQYSRD